MRMTGWMWGEATRAAAGTICTKGFALFFPIVHILGSWISGQVHFLSEGETRKEKMKGH